MPTRPGLGNSCPRGPPELPQRRCLSTSVHVGAWVKLLVRGPGAPLLLTFWPFQQTQGFWTGRGILGKSGVGQGTKTL